MGCHVTAATRGISPGGGGWAALSCVCVWSLSVPQAAYGGSMPAYFRFLTLLAFHVFLREKVSAPRNSKNVIAHAINF